jgi:hypothetical protein
MKKIGLFFVTSLVTAYLLLLCITGNPVRADAKPTCTLSAGAYVDSDYHSKPVVVNSVTTEPGKGLSITKIGIASRSGHVNSVKLRWYLSKEQDKGSILAKGETPEIEIPGGIDEGATKEVQYVVVTFGDYYHQFVKEGRFNGDFRLDVTISEAKFADGRKFTEQAKNALEFGDHIAPPDKKSMFVKASFNSTSSLQSCPITRCTFTTGGPNCPTGCNSSSCCTFSGCYSCIHNDAPNAQSICTIHAGSLGYCCGWYGCDTSCTATTCS